MAERRNIIPREIPRAAAIQNPVVSVAKLAFEEAQLVSSNEHQSLSCEIEVPSSLQPGQEFTVFLEERVCVVLRCPSDFVGNGQRLQFKVPRIMSRCRLRLTFSSRLDVNEHTMVGVSLGSSTALVPYSSDQLEGTTLTVDSFEMKSHEFHVKYPKGKFPERPFLVNAQERLVLLKTPKEVCDGWDFSLPFHEVTGTNVEVIHIPVSIPDPSLWRKIPTPLLSNVLDYLPVREVRFWRLADSHFAAAGKDAFFAKLTRVGVRGSTYEDIIGTVTHFASEADRFQRQSDDFLHYARQRTPPLHMNIVLIPKPVQFRVNTSLGRILVAENLLEQCEISKQLSSRTDGEPTTIVRGVILSRVNLSLYVWVKQYRQELETQLDELLPSEVKTRRRVNEILSWARVLEEAGVCLALASYIPNTSISTGSHFEYLRSALDTSLARKCEERLAGLVSGNEALGINLQYTGLAISTPIPIGRSLAILRQLRQVNIQQERVRQLVLDNMSTLFNL